MLLTALVLDIVFVAVAFGLRTLVQVRRTGDPGWRLGRPHSVAEGVSRALLVGAAMLLLVAAVTVGHRRWPGTVGATGVAVAIASIALVALAQLQMGASWRIGVDPTERTELVTGGIYRRIRNPIYTGMVAFTIGQALMLPTPWAAAAVVAMTVGVQVQVRRVEEPYLVTVHGDRFVEWARRSGRFVPGVGALGTVPRPLSADAP
jgi:protein-S-isoprenylcysteine O-methyltransferase Ste14